MTYATSHGIPIHYSVSGRGDTAVVLLHSYLCSGHMWHNQVGVLEAAYAVINVDARGHGRSGAVGQPFSLEDMVDDVVQVLDAEGVTSAVWVGLSIGGMVALRAALQVPERVDALVLIDSDAGAESVRGRLKFSMMAAVVRLLGMRPIVQPVLELMFGATTLRSRPELVAEWTDRFRAVDVPSMLKTLPALMRRRDLTPRLGEIDVPTLIIVGEEDRSLPPARSRAMAAAIPRSELAEVPGAGHLSVLEEPEAVTALISGFLEQVRGT